MSSLAGAPAVSNATPTEPPKPSFLEEIGADRDFLISMAQLPIISLLFVGCGWLSHILWGSLVGDITKTLGQGWEYPEGSPEPHNLGPVVAICIGMIVAAVIDGWKFKVPNWLTLSIVISGWGIALLHTFNIPIDSGVGGIGASLGGTVLGFFLLAPLLTVKGMGEGDVKMTMGFGSWLGAFYGNPLGLWLLLYAFAAGVLIGGIMGLIMMALRRQFYKNWENTKEIFRDVQVLVTAGPEKAARRAEARHPYRVRLPYGVPLCIGFLGTLLYLYLFNG